MQYIKENTAIAVPSILDWSAEGPCGLDLYVLMEFIHDASNFTANQSAPGYARCDCLTLDPMIGKSTPEFLYRQGRYFATAIKIFIRQDQFSLRPL